MARAKVKAAALAATRAEGGRPGRYGRPAWCLPPRVLV